MITLTRIYTRGGDAGETGLVDGARVSKSDPRIAAIGDVDEANSAIGVAMAAVDGTTRTLLLRIQNELFDLGADLATPGEDFAPSASALRITAAQVSALEQDIDRLNATLPPLASFVLPSGGAGVAAIHLARAIVRRAERSAVAATGTIALNPQALAYLNRLSDLLFVLARAVAREDGGEILWVPGASRS